MGSDSDYPVMAEAGRMLRKFGIEFEVEVVSAHRSPARAAEYAETAAERGLKVIIVGAGGAAHLAGVVAALTTLPVIGVPMAATSLNGMDSLLATVQMPGGVPVGTMAIGKPGATNAGIFAAQILGASDAKIARALAAYKKELAAAVAEKSARLKRELAGEK
ncbi:MAG: 5-(carboxyamino)imidazole ribonucleotide mutase [Candidatus Acidiferrales bacterium]